MVRDVYGVFVIAFAKAICIALLFQSCDSESAWNCTQEAGNIITREYEVDEFDKILVYERMQLFLRHGPEHKVEIQSGENLFNEITANVSFGRLILKNGNSCNLVRDYGVTKVYVTAPDINEVRSSTGEEIRSLNKLRWPALTLLSEDFREEDLYHTTGNFNLDLETDFLKVSANNLSNFYLTGTAGRASLEFYSGDGQIFAEDLVIDTARIFHRGSHHMRLDVRKRLEGVINGYGNVYLEEQPDEVDVDVTWRGRLIIED